jgi:hypothetical protein
MPVAIYLRLSGDERVCRSFCATEAIYIYAHTYTHNGSLGSTTAADIYSALRNTNPRSDSLSKCGQYAASRVSLLLYMVQSVNVVIKHDVRYADDAVYLQ